MASQAATAFMESGEATQTHPSVAARAEDAVVVKRRVGAFSGSDLDGCLDRRKGALGPHREGVRPPRRCGLGWRVGGQFERRLIAGSQ
jgi:hypothetical protein